MDRADIATAQRGHTTGRPAAKSSRKARCSSSVNCARDALGSSGKSPLIVTR
jgi:hypothetical protein